MTHPGDAEFFRFPHTPHLIWLGKAQPRDDKVLSRQEAAAFLAHPIGIEEKLDGANLGFSLGPDRDLRIQNRGQYLTAPYGGQFARLPAWLEQHGTVITSLLQPQLILFGEWCAARHSLDYTALPDWFMVFDVYDRMERCFWSTDRRNDLAARMGLSTVPRVFAGKISIPELQDLLIRSCSQYRNGALEGLIIRRDSAERCEARVKVVRADFIQSIDQHWRKRAIEWNRIKYQ